MTTYTDPSNFKPGNPGTGMAHILMPRHESHQEAMIAPRSGIVMRPAPNDASYSVLHYEGNLHGAMNLNKWQERVMCAAGRLFTNYPTIAKSMLPADQVKNEFENIGDLRWFDSPNTPYLMHLDLECLDALAKMTGEEKHAHVQWALVGEKEDSLRVLATGGHEIASHYRLIRNAQLDGNPSFVAQLNRGYFRDKVEFDDRIMLFFNGIEVDGHVLSNTYMMHLEEMGLLDTEEQRKEQLDLYGFLMTQFDDEIADRPKRKMK